MKISARELFLEEIRKYQENIKLLDTLDDPPKGVKILMLSNLTIKVGSMEDLHKARLWLRKGLGLWEDKLGDIWFGAKDMIAEFTGKHHPITIWISTPPEDFPKELQSDTCKVVKLESSITQQYGYVCKPE